MLQNCSFRHKSNCSFWRRQDIYSQFTAKSCTLKALHTEEIDHKVASPNIFHHSQPTDTKFRSRFTQFTVDCKYLTGTLNLALITRQQVKLFKAASLTDVSAECLCLNLSFKGIVWHLGKCIFSRKQSYMKRLINHRLCFKYEATLTYLGIKSSQLSVWFVFVNTSWHHCYVS